MTKKKKKVETIPCLRVSYLVSEEMRKIIEQELRRESLRAKSYSSRKLREKENYHARFYKILDPYFITIGKGESLLDYKLCQGLCLFCSAYPYFFMHYLAELLIQEIFVD